MKRIDDKIKEIEKKDKNSRVLYIIIVLLIAGFMAYALSSEKKIKDQEKQIDDQVETIEQQLETEKALTKQLDDSINELNRSLKPDEYWNHIRSENTIEGYIGFITNDWGIDKSEFITQAYNRLMDDDSVTKAVGYDGWLFVGSINNADEYTSGNSDGEKTIKIIYRNGGEENIADSEPLVGDVVQLVDTRNRNSYSRKDKVERNSYRNEQGFRNKTKAIVVERHKDPSNTNFYVRLKYY